MLAALVLLVAPLASAQRKPRRDTERGTAVISGVVKDADGKFVAAALVQANEGSGRPARATRTDAEGRFRIAALRRGLWDVRIALKGFETQWKRGIVLRDGESVSLTFTLKSTPPSTPAPEKSTPPKKPA